MSIRVCGLPVAFEANVGSYIRGTLQPEATLRTMDGLTTTQVTTESEFCCQQYSWTPPSLKPHSITPT